MNGLLRIAALAATGLAIAAGSLLLAPAAQPSLPSSGSLSLPPTDCPSPLAVGTIATIAGSRVVPAASSFAPTASSVTPANAATLEGPAGIAVDSSGVVYVTEPSAHQLDRIGLDGIIAQLVSGYAADPGDGGKVSAASMLWPTGLTFDSAGNLYVADFQASRIRRIDPTGMITTVAGIGVSGSGGNGEPATSATINATQVSIGGKGDLYFDDSASFRHVDPSGIIGPFAGHPSSTTGFSGDGGPALDATFGEVRGTAVAVVGGADTVYLVDAGNHRIRLVDGTGIISTVVGTGVAGYAGDGGSAHQAQVNDPNALALDDAGNLYISDSGSPSIRRVDRNGIITTVAGTGTAGNSGDCGPAASAQLVAPYGIAVRGDLLYIADTSANVIRVVRL